MYLITKPRAFNKASHVIFPWDALKRLYTCSVPNRKCFKIFFCVWLFVYTVELMYLLVTYIYCLFKLTSEVFCEHVTWSRFVGSVFVPTLCTFVWLDNYSNERFYSSHSVIKTKWTHFIYFVIRQSCYTVDTAVFLNLPLLSRTVPNGWKVTVVCMVWLCFL